MSSSQKLRAVSQGDAGGAPESERRIGVQATLVSLLEMAYGSRGQAIGAVERALAIAGRDYLPDAPADLLAFVRAHLLGVLSVEIGPRLTMALVDDLVARYDEPAASQGVASPPPPSMHRPVARVALRARSAPPAIPQLRVLLVDPDRVGRATLARALVRARWGVGVVESVEDLHEGSHDKEPPDAVIVDLHHPAAAPILDALLAAMPGLPVIVRGADGPTAHELLRASRGARVELRSREAPPEELIDAVRRAVAVQE